MYGMMVFRIWLIVSTPPVKNNTFKLQRAGLEQAKVESDCDDEERMDQSLGLVNKVKNLF